MSKKWSLNSWVEKQIYQQPNWYNHDKHKKVINEISKYPPLVFAGEIRTLKSQLAEVAKGNSFLIQGGDCAETFNDFNANSIKNKLKILLQMSVVLTYGASRNIVKIGRIAGQFAKPRSSDFETRGDVTLPIYRGDAINGIDFTIESRQHNSERLLKTYNQSASTLNLLRAFTYGGFADLNKVHLWNQKFISSSPQGKKYKKIAANIDGALQFMDAVGISSPKFSTLRTSELYTSHEALLLDYEQALTRKDTLSNSWYDCSAHFLWIGDRTRQVDGAHVEFLSGVNNPIGIKAGPSLTPDNLVKLAYKLNPNNELGRLTVITRMGAKKINNYLPKLIECAKKEGLNLLWVCDPMHGNTYKSETGYKTRHFDTMLEEIQKFFKIHKKYNTIPGGIHFEMTGEKVTECLGGAQKINDDDLKNRYETACDPRLNNEQSLELAFQITELLHINSNK